MPQQKLPKGISFEPDRCTFRWRVHRNGKIHEQGRVKAKSKSDRCALREAIKIQKLSNANADLCVKKEIRLASTVTYDSCKENYLAKLEQKKSLSRKNRIKESTIQRYQTSFQNHLDPYFKGRLISYMNNANTLEQFQSFLLKKKAQRFVPASKKLPSRIIECDHNLSHATINRACELARAMLNHLVTAQKIPFSNYRLEPLDEDLEADAELSFLENESEIQRFLAAAKRLSGSGNQHVSQIAPSPYYGLYVTAIFTGLRKGELKGLNVSDINFNTGTITIERQWLTRLKKFGPTKSGKPRYVTFEIDGELSQVLRETVNLSNARRNNYNVICENSQNALFTNSFGKRITADSFAGKHFKSILRHACLDSGITFHGLRRTFANWYYRQVGKIQPVQEMLGHANEETTRGYLNLTKKNLPEAPKVQVLKKETKVTLTSAKFLQKTDPTKRTQSLF